MSDFNREKCISGEPVETQTGEEMILVYLVAILLSPIALVLAIFGNTLRGFVDSMKDETEFTLEVLIKTEATQKTKEW